MLTQYSGIQRPDKAFNLFYLDENECLITSVKSKIRSNDFENEKGICYLTSRSIYFQSDYIKVPIIKFKLTNPDFSYIINQTRPSSVFHSPKSSNKSQFNTISGSTISREKQMRHSCSNFLEPQSPKQSSRIMKHHRSLSSDSLKVMIINVKSFVLIPRHPVTPAYSQFIAQTFYIEMPHNELHKFTAELDMTIRCHDEKQLIDLIYGVRYKDFISKFQLKSNTSEEALLYHKCKRVLLETEQRGIFLLNQKGMQFHPIINALPYEIVSMDFKDIRFCMKYRYLARDTGLMIYSYIIKYPILLIFESESQRDNIFTFLQARAKFKNPIESLFEHTERWKYGQLTNFEYLIYLNNLSNRSSLDLTQYPIFPWVISSYHGESNSYHRSTNKRQT